MNYEKIEKNILEFLRDYLVTSGAKGFVLGLSGGLDSAVVATLCAKIAPTHALLMPTRLSNEANLKDALRLAKTLGLNHKIIDISNILESFCVANGLSKQQKLRYGNLCARVRMCLLYDYSSEHALLVVGTSNKSERLLGYGTIFGDMACALNPIGELFKSEIFEFADFLGVDKAIINKAPSADLWENQSDESELGYSYKELDGALDFILKGLGNSRISKAEILGGKISNAGILGDKIPSAGILEFCKKRMKNNAFKLNTPAIAKVPRN